MSHCPNTGHFGIVAGCTHNVTVLSRNGEPRRIEILKWVSRRWDVGIWTGLGWPRIETGGGRL